MIIKKKTINGIYTIEQELRGDHRGYFTRVFCKHELGKAGISYDIVQINRSLTAKKGTIRGLHYQLPTHAEDKIIQCIKGEIFDVAVDLRKHSKTYGQWVSEVLSETNHKMMLVPKGCAHGFQTLKANSVVEYFVSAYYAPEYERGIRWNDPFFHIQWPLKKVTTSEKDGKWPNYEK